MRTKYIFKPKHDITAYELAKCVEIIIASQMMQIEFMIAAPENVKRHFQKE